MSKRDKPFSEPEDDYETFVSRYGRNNEYIELISKKYKNTKRIKLYNKLNSKEMVNITTGEIKLIKHKENKNEKQVFKGMKGITKVVVHNMRADGTEILAILKFAKEMSDYKEVHKKWKNFWEKLKRRIPNIEFIRVLLYENKNYPFFHVWLTTTDDSKIEIEQEVLEQLWSVGTVEIIRIDKSNFEEMSAYFTKKVNPHMDLYPAKVQLCGTSKGIKKVEIAPMKYGDIKKEIKAKGYSPTFQKLQVQIEKIDNIEQEVQQTFYQTFRRNKRKIKLSNKLNRKYRRKRK